MNSQISMNSSRRNVSTLPPPTVTNLRSAALLPALVWALLGLIELRAASPVQESFRAGLAAEEVAHNVPEAIRHYETTLRLHTEDRTTAATALVRMADLYKRQGQANPALAAYRRVVLEFPDQTNLVQLAQAQLPESENALNRGKQKDGRARSRELIEQEIHLVELEVRDLKGQVPRGVASVSDLRKAERDLLHLRREQIEAEPRDLLEVSMVPGISDGTPPPGEALMERRRELEVQIRRLESLRSGQGDLVRFYLREQPTPRLISIQAKLDELDLKVVELNAKAPKIPAEKELNDSAMEGLQRQRAGLHDLRALEVSLIRDSIEIQTKTLAQQLAALRTEMESQDATKRVK